MVEIKDLAFNYGKSDMLFKNLTLSLQNSGICGLLGKNGAGKTTLLKILAGLIFPQHGSCQVMGYLPERRQPSFLQEVYFLPEELFVPNLTAKAYLEFYAPLYPRFNTALFHNCLKEFDLPKHKLLTQLSYGQKKKFLIAFGLATDCRLFILDEPTNGLDITSKAQFRKLIASTINDDKLFVISTHQVHDVENLIDDIVIVDEGKVVFHQNTAAITQQLAFVQQPTQPETSFYAEKRLGSYVAVMPNNNNEDTQIDLEILFNAVLLNKATLPQLFQEKQV